MIVHISVCDVQFLEQEWLVLLGLGTCGSLESKVNINIDEVEGVHSVRQVDFAPIVSSEEKTDLVVSENLFSFAIEG